MRGGKLVCAVGLIAATAFAGAHDALDAAIGLYDAKKSEQAVKALREVVGLPDATPAIRSRAHLYMGLALAKLGEKVASDAAFADAFALDPMLAVPFGTRQDIAERAEKIRTETKARQEAKRDMAEWSGPTGPSPGTAPPPPTPQPDAPPPQPLAQAQPVGPPPRPLPQPAPAGPDPLLAAPALPGAEPLPPLPPPTASPAPSPSAPPRPAPRPVVRAPGTKKKSEDDGVHFGLGMRFIWNPVDDVVGPAGELNFGNQSGGVRLGGLFTLFPGRNWGVGGALRVLFGPVIYRWRIEFGFDLGAIIYPTHLQTAIEVTHRVLGFSFPAGPVRVNVQLLTAGLYMNFVSNPIAVIPTLTAGFGVEY